MGTRKKPGAIPAGRATKIVATVGPRADQPGVLEGLLSAGVDVFRLNGAHCRPSDIARRTARIREAEEHAGRPVGVLLDLGGPKIRVGKIEGDAVEWRDGERVEIVPGEAAEGARCFSVTYPALLADVKPGAEVRIDDGKVRLVVLSRSGESLRARVLVGGSVRAGAGVNFPHSALSAPALTPKDRRDLAEGIEAGIDFVGLSFVRSVEHVLALRRLLERVPANRRPWVVAKVERVEAVRDLTAIAMVSDVLMVARGDLGVEIGLAAVPGVQRAILATGRRLGVPVIVATQMLESMIEHPTPTRAEVSDVAGAVHDGADAVMLSGETAVGAYPLEAVRTMAEIAATAERLELDAPPSDRTFSPDDPTAVVAALAARAARLSGARALVIYTATGRTARLLSKEALPIPILAVTPFEEVRRKAALLRSVVSYRIPVLSTVEEVLRAGDGILLGLGLGGATVVEVSGSALAAGATNTLRVRKLGEPGEGAGRGKGNGKGGVTARTRRRR